MEAIRLEKLSKNYGALQVFKDLDLVVDAGQYVALIGPNGAGKTTLLNVVTGEIPPSGGRIYVFGQDVVRAPSRHRVRIGLARSFQLNRPFHDLTVFENVYLGVQGTMPGRYQMFRPVAAQRDAVTRVHELLKLADLWQERNEPVKNMSYGIQRRMEIILSLASKPRVLLLDEPSAGLSLAETADFMNTIKALGKDVTVIFAAHDMDVVFGLADRVVVLYTGKFIGDGTPEEIRCNPLVRECYLGAEENNTNAGVG